MDSRNILEIQDLHLSIPTEKGVLRIVNGVDLSIPHGSVVGLVGESGCGKTMTAKSILRIFRKPARIDSGRLLFDGRDLAALTEREMQDVRGNDISMVFQEPMTALNPVLKVGRQVQEVLLTHKKASSAAEARQQVIRLFERVGIPEAEHRFSCYPHELSGGLCQRVMIAMAMVCSPKLLVADEPTTALDVTIEAQILRLMQELQRQEEMSILLISHNMGVVAQICDYIYVMYAGRIVEHAPVFELFDHPEHPYTRGLLESIPRIGRNQEYLTMIPGVVPNLLHLKDGCAFAGRCPWAKEGCRAKEPSLEEIRQGHFCSCFEACKLG